MERLSSSRSAIYKISQIVKTKQLARRWRKLAAIPTAITGIKHALSLGFSYHYVQDVENKINGDSESTSGLGVPGDVSEGHLAVYAVNEEELLERFVIPVAYLNDPLFSKLLRNAEEEFAFNYRSGGLTLPCEPSVLAHIIHLLKHVPHHHDRLTVQNAASCSSAAARAWPASPSQSRTTTCGTVDIKGRSVTIY